VLGGILMRIWAFTTVLLLLTGCALAPFSGQHTARTAGKGKNILASGFSPSPYVQYARGVDSNLDLGAGLELQFGYTLHTFAKYAFQQKRQGFSLAGVAGAGLGFSILNTQFIHLGPTMSWRQKDLEFYLHPRINLLFWDSYNPTDDSTDDFEIKGGSIVYYQTNTGFQYYFNPSFAAGLGFVLLTNFPGNTPSTSLALNFLVNY
jgi:hypothetical protein